MQGAVTVDELADVMTGAGKPIGRATIRYHCRDPRGALYGVARRSGRTWLIPVDAADAFARDYQPWGSLRKSAPERPPLSGAATVTRTPTREGK